MIKITPFEASGPHMAQHGYAAGRKGIAAIVLPVTRFLRAVNAERYIEPRERLLDIGCGDGYFIRRSRCAERYGLDKRLGDEVVDSLGFPDNYFDYVTMLAVIEHISDPGALLRDIHRVLKPGGRLVLTTPKRGAEFLIRLYARNIEEEHKVYYDLDLIRKNTGGLFDVIGHHAFLFGLNQAFCLEKRRNDEPGDAGSASRRA